MDLNEEQIRRYSRHILLKGIGGVGQGKLLSSKVLIVGAGGLGSPIALYLAAAGVGTIGIADDDAVELSNLQRQIIHTTDDVGTAKVRSAKDKIEKINPDVKVRAIHERISAESIREIISEYDFIVEGTDNFPTKFLVNDACVFEGKPFNQGGILRFEGQTMTYAPGRACYRCVYPSPPPKGTVPTCAEAGVFGAIVGILGSIQAAETIKYLTGVGTPLVDRVLMFDSLSMKFRTVSVSRSSRCPVCGESPTITEIKEYEQPACEIPSTSAAVAQNTR